MTERPTLEAVAARAGVSRATVSRVVNGGAGVRAELQAKVHQAVDELGYVPNQAARTLVTRRTGAVGVVIAEPESRVFSDPFFARQLRGIGRELSAADSQLVLLLVTMTVASTRLLLDDADAVVCLSLLCYCCCCQPHRYTGSCCSA